MLRYLDLEGVGGNLRFAQLKGWSIKPVGGVVGNVLPHVVENAIHATKVRVTACCRARIVAGERWSFAVKYEHWRNQCSLSSTRFWS